ncbi:glutamate receptor ionotropic, kainate 2-like [Haliotis rubra]|uniref:glutamate receptor ionotropic, kainate 2-like n=1 Tax=Haliotis rubra TaxID=36100 RepID=UPI001EE5BA18|nr:glutamate receptor ionotropic, kainate 2-like [Haliotis rubra]
MAITDISITYERDKIVDFAFPFMMDTTSIIVRESADDTRKIWTFTWPFKWEVYVCLTLAFIVVFLMVSAVELSDCKNAVASTRTLKRADIFWYMFGVPFRQGNEQMFRHARSRVLFVCWWALTCLMTASFCCNLIAFLTVNTQSPPFETAMEMATQTNFKWGCVSGGSFLTQFKMSNVTMHKLLLEGIQKFSQSDPDILSPYQDVHLKKLLTEDYAFIAGRPLSNYWRSRNCQLRILKDDFFPVRYSFAFPNGSPYKKIVSDIILRLLDTGVIERLTQAWWPENKCSQPAKTKGQAVTLVDVQSSFYSLLVGVVVAGAVLLMERVHRR